MTIYCTYLTIYRGNKLPPFYIGSSSVAKIEQGYHGSVCSKEYSSLWKTELNEHPELFKTKIISKHSTRLSAFEREKQLQQQLSVISNSLYINKTIGAPRTFGTYNEMYGKDGAKKLKLSRSQSNKNRESTMAAKKWHIKQGQTLSARYKAGIIKKPKGIFKKTKCVKCGKISNIGNIFRWHNENCIVRTSKSSIYRNS